MSYKIQKIYSWTLLSLVALFVSLTVITCASPAAQPEVVTEPTATPIASEALPSPTTVEEAASERDAGKMLRMFLWQAPDTVNPHLAPGEKDQFVSRITYEPLASFDSNGKLIPFLAAEIPSLENGDVAKDGKSVTWKLKQGIKWSDGEPFTADDVLFTFEYATNPAIGTSSSNVYSTVKSVEVLDDYTVKVNFKDVSPAWAIPFVGVRGMIIPRHVFQDYAGSNYAEAPANRMAVGTGPYRVVDFVTEDILIISGNAVNTTRVVYEPNPFYRDPSKPYFSRIEVQGGGGDANFAAQALLDGLTDYSWTVIAKDQLLAQLEAAENITLVSSPGPNVERIMINFTDPHQETDQGERSSLQFPHPFLTDLKVRQAINLAIDRDAIGKIYGRKGVPTSNFLVSPPNYVSPNTSYAYSPEKATQLLQEAGWVDSDGDGVREKNGVSLSLLYQTSINAVRQQVQEIVKKNLEAVGFEVELKTVDASIYFSSDTENPNTMNHFYADLEEFAAGSENPDPDSYMVGWTCAQSPQRANKWGGWNVSRYCNPDYERLYQQAMVELDPEKRRRLMIAMNDLLVENVVGVPLIHLQQIAAITSDLEGLAPTPWDMDSWNIADWRRK